MHLKMCRLLKGAAQKNMNWLYPQKHSKIIFLKLGIVSDAVVSSLLDSLGVRFILVGIWRTFPAGAFTSSTRFLMVWISPSLSVFSPLLWAWGAWQWLRAAWNCRAQPAQPASVALKSWDSHQFRSGYWAAGRALTFIWTAQEKSIVWSSSVYGLLVHLAKVPKPKLVACNNLWLWATVPMISDGNDDTQLSSHEYPSGPD